MQTTIIKNSFEELKKVGRGIINLRFFKFAHIRKIFGLLSRKEKILVLTFSAILLLDIFAVTYRFYRKNTTEVPGYGGSYSEGVVGEPRFINPVLAQNQADKDLVRLVYSGLYKYDNKGSIVPDLAESNFQLSEDQKQYTVKLKQGLKWHDGADITADDVIYTIQTLQNADYKSPFRKLWQNITVEKVDNLTIKFTNPDVSSPFITNLTVGILPAHIWSKISADNFYFARPNLEPVGSGPYLVKEISKAINGDVRSIKMESFSNYAAGKPYIDNLELKFYPNYEQLMSGLHTKEVDAIGFVPFDKNLLMDVNRSKPKINGFALQQYQGLFFNLQKSSKVLGDRNVRVALQQTLNRNDLINNVFSGLAKPAITPILPGQLGYDPAAADVIKFDPQNALTNLDAAGWVKGQDGQRAKGNDKLHFTITTNDFVLNVKTAEELKRQWSQYGFSIDINIVPTAELERNSLRSRNFEALLFSESTGFDPDPFAFWHSSQSKDPGFNLAQYTNTAVDKLITSARSTFDSTQRVQAYKEFQNYFALDIPAIIIDQSLFVYENRKGISGQDMEQLASPEDRFMNINKWYLTTKRTFKK